MRVKMERSKLRQLASAAARTLFAALSCRSLRTEGAARDEGSPEQCKEAMKPREAQTMFLAAVLQAGQHTHAFLVSSSMQHLRAPGHLTSACMYCTCMIKFAGKCSAHNGQIPEYKRD